MSATVSMVVRVCKADLTNSSSGAINLSVPNLAELDWTVGAPHCTRENIRGNLVW